MSRFLMVTWDGAGNLIPTLGIADALSAAGHDVRVLGHPAIDERYARRGWQFVPFATAAAYDSVHPGDLADEMPFLMENVFFGEATARDTLTEFDRDGADLVICDALMAGVLCAAEALPAPAVALYHTAYSLFRGGPLVEMIAPGLPTLDPFRVELGLAPVSTLAELHDRTDLGLVAAPAEFEPPGAPIDSRIRFVGPILDRPTVSHSPATPAGRHEDNQPRVLVSFSTSDMAQASMLQRVIDALGSIDAEVLVTTGPAVDPEKLVPAANTRIVSYIPHADILGDTSLVVTHGGMGTVMTALAHGVPIVGLPMGRDQFYNVTRVSEFGAGTSLPPDPTPGVIAKTVADALRDPNLGDTARTMAETISTYGGAAAAVTELETLASAR